MSSPIPEGARLGRYKSRNGEELPQCDCLEIDDAFTLMQSKLVFEICDPLRSPAQPLCYLVYVASETLIRLGVVLHRTCIEPRPLVNGFLLELWNRSGWP